MSAALPKLYIARAQIDAAIATLEGRIIAPAVAVTRTGRTSRRAANRTDAELDAIRVDYISDMPTAEVVAKHGISLNSLYTTAYQHGWKRPPRARRPLAKAQPQTPKPSPPKPAAPAAEVHPAEAHARHTLTQAGYKIAQLGEARWDVNGVEIDRTLFVTLGYHVRTKQPLPPEWLKKTKA